MKNLYYALWVDVIVNSKGYKNKEPDWKATAYFLITVTNALNFFILLLWLDFFNINARKYLFIFESKSMLTSALGGFINFGLPFAIINYYAIFYKKRYLKLIAKHPAPYNGRFALTYILGSILLVVISVIITA
jgi:hypothetical protein